MRIIQRSELRTHTPSFPSSFSSEDISKQGLDTNVFALLSGHDECGKVQNFNYSEDNVIDAYSDPLDVPTTNYQTEYYQGIAQNSLDNSSQSLQQSDNQSVTNSVSSDVSQSSDNQSVVNKS